METQRASSPTVATSPDFGGSPGTDLDLTLRSFNGFLGQLRATANPSTARSAPLSADELRKQAEFESLDYYKPYPDMYMAHVREAFLSPSARGDSVGYRNAVDTNHTSSLADQNRSTRAYDEDDAGDSGARLAHSFAHQLQQQLPSYHSEADRNEALRWCLHLLIAVSVGVMATVVSYAVEGLEKYRESLLVMCLHSAPVRVLGDVVGLACWVGVSVALVLIAASVVVWYEPAAAGGGIPDVMAYLNGVHLRKAMNLRTFIAKAISCVAAVASGLPVGLEAPLIHLGAITGAGVTQGRSRTLGFQTALFGAFRNNKDRRDFITAGAACGVSVAFGAPIGGLLFVMEEVSSFWDHSASGQIFLATMICFTVSTIVNSIVEDQRLLGWVSNAAHVLFEVNITIPLNLVSIVPSLCLGAVLGALAALFTKLNLLLIQWRRTHIKPYPLRRLADPVLLMVLFSVLTFGFAMVVECRPVKPIEDANETVHVWGTEAQARLFNGTCTTEGTYSPLGSLSMSSGKNVIRHLFSRQTAAEFPVHQLLLFFVFYFLAACAVSGAAVSGGLVVPSLVIGALFGRLYGLLLWYAGAAEVDVAGGYRSVDAWMDPGVFALIGAGAFLAGTSRMTMSICVIMVELSSELHYLLPVMVAIVMSKTAADWLCEPLYHQQMRLECVPYLPPHLLRPEFEMLTAADAMAADVVMLRTRERTDVIVRALRETTHHAFPVVDLKPLDADVGDPVGQDHLARAARSLHYKFVGLVTREDLQVLLTLPELHEGRGGSAEGTATRPRVPLSDPESDGFGGRLEPAALAVRSMTWSQFNAHKTSLFLHMPDRHDWIRRHDPADHLDTEEGPAVLPQARSHLSLFALASRYTASEAGANADGSDDGVSLATVHDPVATTAHALASMPDVLDLSLIVNRSPWVIPPFFNLQMAYHTFRSMGLRHMVVVDGDVVAGIITRKDLLPDALTRRTRELRDRLGEVIRSRAPSMPASYTSRAAVVQFEEQGSPAVPSPAVGETNAAAPAPSLTRDIMDDLFGDEL